MLPRRMLLLRRPAFPRRRGQKVAASLLDILECVGAKVFGPVSDVKRALEILREPSFVLDVAVSDINLNGQLVYPTAALLAERGTPFVFVTGYWRCRCLMIC